MGDKKFFIRHVDWGDYDYSDHGSKEAAWEAEKGESWVTDYQLGIEAAKAEFIGSLLMYTLDDLVEVYEDGEDWPLDLQLISLVYEVRNTFDTGFDGCYDCYEDTLYLSAGCVSEAIAEVEVLQEKHDAAHIAKYGKDASYSYAPRYRDNLWEIAPNDEEWLIET